MRAKLFHDDGAGSLVVGATLLVATAIVLASTTAAFVLGERADNAPPEANFTYEYSQIGHGNLTIVHESGETLDADNIQIAADTPFRPAPGNASGTLQNAPVESYTLDSAAAGSEWLESDIEPGTEFGIVGESPDNLEPITVRIVWVEPDGGDTVVLGEWRGPDA